MFLRDCRECEYYIMDDGHEVSCRYRSEIAYYQITINPSGAKVLSCPVVHLTYGATARSRR